MRISTQAVGSLVSGDLWVCRAGTVPLIQGARCGITSAPGAELNSCRLLRAGYPDLGGVGVGLNPTGLRSQSMDQGVFVYVPVPPAVSMGTLVVLWFGGSR